jgi:hypothetical protein
MTDESRDPAASLGSAPEEFKIADVVFWGSVSNGRYKRKVGIVVAVVEAGESPVPPGWLKCNSSAGYGLPRNHRSYLVRVGNRMGCYWPRVKHLRRVE